MKWLSILVLTFSSIGSANIKPEIMGRSHLVIPLTHPLSLQQIVNQSVLLIDDHDLLTANDVQILSESSCNIEAPLLGRCILYIVVSDNLGLVSDPYPIIIDYIESSHPTLYAPTDLWLPSHLKLSTQILDLLVTYDRTTLSLTIEKLPTREDSVAVVAVTSEYQESYYHPIQIHPISHEYDVILGFDGETMHILSDQDFRLSYLKLKSFFMLIDESITSLEYNLDCTNESVNPHIICGDFILNNDRHYQVAITKQHSISIDRETWNETWNNFQTSCNQIFETIYEFITHHF